VDRGKPTHFFDILKRDSQHPEYAARLQIDYPEKLDKLTTFFRIIWIIPIAVILGLISQTGETVTKTLNQTGEIITATRLTVGGLASGLLAATALMTIFRQRYPRWWFDFSRELTRFAARVSAYLSCSPTNILRLSTSNLST
jgi:hypothetical protein